MNDTETPAPDLEISDHATLRAPTTLPSERRGLSRRRLLGAVGIGVAAVAAGAAALSRRHGSVTDEASSSSDSSSVSFFGTHQAGIATPAQDRLHFAAFDVTTMSRDRLIRLLQEWTDAAAMMTRGLPVGEFGGVDGSPLAPPDDTGEAAGMTAAGVATLLIVQDVLGAPPAVGSVASTPGTAATSDVAIVRGLRWLDRRFTKVIEEGAYALYAVEHEPVSV